MLSHSRWSSRGASPTRLDASRGEGHQQQGQQLGQAAKELISSHLHAIGQILDKLKLSPREERAWKAIQDNAMPTRTNASELSLVIPTQSLGRLGRRSKSS